MAKDSSAKEHLKKVFCYRSTMGQCVSQDGRKKEITYSLPFKSSDGRFPEGWSAMEIFYGDTSGSGDRQVDRFYICPRCVRYILKSRGEEPASVVRVGSSEKHVGNA